MGTQEYQTARMRLDANNAASEQWRKEHKKNGIPVEVCKTFPFAEVVNNELRSQIEVYEFMHEKPAKYFLYIDEKTTNATTWTGDVLGSVWFGREYRSNMGDKRQPITVYGINGVKYAGIYYKSSGDYARVKALKAQ